MRTRDIKYSIFLIFTFICFSATAQNTLDIVGLSSATPAAAAYSFRKLSASYSGPLVRLLIGTNYYDVYPDASNKVSSTSLISPAITNYNDAIQTAGSSALSSMVVAGTTNATLAAWYDQSGNNRHVYQATSSAQPSVITNGTFNTNGNGIIAPKFNYSYLQTIGNANWLAGIGYTINSVSQILSASGSRAFVGINISASNQGLHYGDCNASTFCLNHYYNDASFTMTASTDLRIKTAIKYNGSGGSQAWLNGTSLGTSSYPNSNLNASNAQLNIGSGQNTSPSWTGYISEIIIFTSELSVTNRQIVEGNQINYYAINTTSSLINSSTDGGFESGSTIAANGWNVVNATNMWVVGTSTKNTGSYSAYVSADGTTYGFNQNAAGASHLYKDIAIPASLNHIVLSFKMKGNRQYYAGSFYDKLLVYTAPTSVTPSTSVPGSPATTFSGATLVYQQDNDYANYSLIKIVLPSSLAGTTVRLIFTWLNDSGNSSGNPASVDDISLTADYRNDWNGAVSTDWNNSANWSQGVVPTNLHNIYIPSGVTNIPTLSQSVTINDLVLNANINLNNNQLTVNGSIACNAYITGSANASLIINNSNFYDVTTGAISLKMNQTTLGSTNVLNTFTLNNSYGGGVSLGNSLRITNALNLNNGTLSSNDNITLVSNANGTAIVGPVTNGATITGKAMVEKYIPARRAFRLVASPVTTSTDIRTNWQESGSASANYGTQITGTGGSSSGFDISQTNNPSLFTHDNNTATWAAATNTYSTFSAGAAYRLMIRGDRTIDLFNQTPTPTNTTLRTFGTLYTGSKTITINTTSNASKYSMIGNPYQAPVDMQSVLSTNATNIQSAYYYIWDPTLNTRGAYVTVDLANNTNASGSAANKFLQPGQACFIKTTTSGAASIIFTEGAKGTALTNTFKTTANETYLNIKLYQSDSFMHNATVADAVRVRLDPIFNNALDESDATKALNQDENIAINSSGQLLGIEARNLPLLADTISLELNQYRNTKYLLKLETNNFNNLQAVLIDRYNQNHSAINSSAIPTLYSFVVDPNVPASMASDRFFIQLKPNTSTHAEALEQRKPNFILYPNPNDGKVLSLAFNAMEGQNVQITILNLLGQKLYAKKVFIPSNAFTWTDEMQLQPGCYHIQVMDLRGASNTQTLIIR
jgi:hypothetical protein